MKNRAIKILETKNTHIHYQPLREAVDKYATDLFYKTFTKHYSNNKERIDYVFYNYEQYYLKKDQKIENEIDLIIIFDFMLI